ncbi:Polyamine transporter 3 [Exophiala dermatitidis]
MAGPRVADSLDDVGQIPTANDKDHNVIIMGGLIRDGILTDSVSPSSRSGPEVVCFSEDDPENPYNWGLIKKLFIALTAIVLVLNSTISSAITSNAMPYIMKDFGIKGEIQSYLPTTVYLIGYTFGPLVFSPMSESFGRKVVTFWTFNVFILGTLACALAPNWPSLLAFRVICGTCASVPLTVIGGLYADIFLSPRTRGRAMITFMSGTTFGPLGGPIISGYVAPIGWRWVFWVVLIIAGCSWIPLAFMPETFGPVILKKRAQKTRKVTGNNDIFAMIELENKSAKQLITTSLSRPLRMLCFEPLVYLNCLYIALLYAFFYLFFEAYPIIFQGIYGFTRGQSGLALSPIGVGAAFTGPVLVCYDTMFERARKRGTAWALSEELHRLPIACLGGPFVIISLFWLGWTARQSIHWAVPCMSGLFFGFGYLLIFTALTNYQVDAYEIFAASAMAASCFSRSIVGAALPLAAKPLYHGLGVAWASSVLGFLSLLLFVIPFGLIYYGPRIREKSQLCQALSKRNGMY